MSDAPTLDEDLGGGIEFRMEPTADADLRVQAFDTNGGHTAIYSAVHPRDWFTKQQTRREILNNIVDQLPAGVDADTVAGELEDLFTTLDAQADKVRERLRPPDVERVLDNTEGVRVYGGDETTFVVDLSLDGRETTLEFTAGEWANHSPGPLKTQFANAFYEVLELDAEQWREIRGEWQDQMVEASREQESPDQMVAEQVLDKLRRRRQPVDSKEQLGNDRAAALWDAVPEDREDDDETGRQILAADVPDDESVLWVQSQCLLSALDDVGKNENFKAQLSKILQEQGDTFGPSSRHRIDGDRYSLWPFDPDTLDVGYWDVVEEEDAGGVEP